MSDHIHFAILYLEIFLPAPTPSLILSLLWWSVWPTSTFTTTIATDDYDDEWWINRACITDSMKFPIELFSAFNSLFSSFSLHFSCLCFFVKKISLTFYWQLSCVSNQDIDFLISITEYRLKVKTDIMNFEWGYVKFKIVEDKYELRILKRLFEIQNLRKSNVPH